MICQFSKYKITMRNDCTTAYTIFVPDRNVSLNLVDL